MSDIKKEFENAIVGRLNTPIIGSMLIAIAAINWRCLIHIFSIQGTARERIQAILEDFQISWLIILTALIVALIYAIADPVLKWWTSVFVRWVEVRAENNYVVIDRNKYATSKLISEADERANRAEQARALAVSNMKSYQNKVKLLVDNLKPVKLDIENASKWDVGKISDENMARGRNALQAIFVSACNTKKVIENFESYVRNEFTELEITATDQK